jgi:hypothetical protein
MSQKNLENPFHIGNAPDADRTKDNVRTCAQKVLKKPKKRYLTGTALFARLQGARKLKLKYILRDRWIIDFHW